jgi:hypothetical protein
MGVGTTYSYSVIGAAFLRAGADQVIIAGSEDVRGPEPLYARRCTSVVQSLRASPIEA